LGDAGLSHLCLGGVRLGAGQPLEDRALARPGEPDDADFHGGDQEEDTDRNRESSSLLTLYAAARTAATAVRRTGIVSGGEDYRASLARRKRTFSVQVLMWLGFVKVRFRTPEWH